MLGMKRLERDSLVLSQASSDREPFGSVVTLQQSFSSPLTAFRERHPYVEGGEDLEIGVGGFLDGPQMPGTFPEDQAFDDDSLCAFM